MKVDAGPDSKSARWRWADAARALEDAGYDAAWVRGAHRGPLPAPRRGSPRHRPHRALARRIAVAFRAQTR